MYNGAFHGIPPHTGEYIYLMWKEEKNLMRMGSLNG
jgi:hypothetical protein